jgi:hypothetical protein
MTRRRTWHDTTARVLVALFCVSVVLSTFTYFVAPWLIAAWFVSGMFR